MRSLIISVLVGILAVAAVLVIQAGDAAAGEGAVALQTADPSCADDSGDVYVNCGNGTVTDNRTGLVWLRNADCLNSVTPGNGPVDWFTAAAFVAGLADLSGSLSTHDCGLSDNSSPGEWRLPSAAEWQTMVADAVAMNCQPAITDDSGLGCWSDCADLSRSCSFTHVASANYHSATTDTGQPSWVLGVLIFDGSAVTGPRTTTRRVWPVRGGQ